MRIAQGAPLLALLQDDLFHHATGKPRLGSCPFDRLGLAKRLFTAELFRLMGWGLDRGPAISPI